MTLRNLDRKKARAILFKPFTMSHNPFIEAEANETNPFTVEANETNPFETETRHTINNLPPVPIHDIPSPFPEQIPTGLFLCFYSFYA